MNCAWQAYLNLLPMWMRQDVDKQGRETLLELRLRINQPPTLITIGGTQQLRKPVTLADIEFCINMASQYSPWNTASIAQGYITASGGHRVGICGTAVCKDRLMTGIRTPRSLCIRVARDHPGIAKRADSFTGSVLIIGRPGSGKTTLLRDLIRRRSYHECVAVVDEREEIFPVNSSGIIFPMGMHTDILSGCPKVAGIDSMLRCMSPDTIAIDEITTQADCDALIRAGWCGVKLIATAHATNKEDLRYRPVYKPIVDTGLFDTLLVLHDDKTWHSERMAV